MLWFEEDGFGLVTADGHVTSDGRPEAGPSGSRGGPVVREDGLVEPSRYPFFYPI